MEIPFRNLFNKVRARVSQEHVAAPAAPTPLPAPLNKTESDKFAKTVRPNAVRTVARETAPPPEPPTPAPGPRIVSFGRPPASPRARDLPPAVALALEPNVERVLSLALADVLEAVPSEHLKPRASFDVNRRVLLKASEVEKGMAMGRPTIALTNLYKQMPEIFMHPIPAGDASEVVLPFQKVVAELSSLHVRNDQMTEIVPQVDTPFLQVTIEDTKRFGTTMAPITIGETGPVRVELATAEALAAAQPEATASESFIPSSVPMTTLPMTSRQAVQPPAPTMPASIPLPDLPVVPAASPEAAPSSDEISPNGTGAPAITRVPASGGPPVPTSESAVPARIPFSGVDPGQETMPAAPEATTRGAPSEPAVELPLRPILQSLPPMQLNGDPAAVPADAKIAFPFSLVAPQLASGRVAIKPSDFHTALGAAYQQYFLADAIDAPVSLSLPDVLANLPTDALRMRDDQEVVVQDDVFETPFSAKAQEDAKRFASSQPLEDLPAAEDKTEPLSAPAEPAKKVRATKEGKGKAAKKGGPHAAPSQPAPAPKLDAKEAVSHACALPGVDACSVIFSDGLSLAGNISPELGIDGVSAVAPTLLHKLEQHMLETKLGSLICMTIHGEKSPVSFFVRGNVCLTAVHNGTELKSESRRELARMAEELSQTYSQPETAHVDH